MRLTYLTCFLLFAGCASHAPATTTTTATVVVNSPCQAAVAGSDLNAWRQYETRDFSVCLPDDWQVERNGARAGTSTIAWGRGEPPKRSIIKTTQRVTVMQGEPLPTEPPAIDGDVRRSTETISGERAVLWRNRFGGGYYTGVKWEAPALWLVGDAASAKAADLEMTIFHTVRFAPLAK